jgi:LysM repeat protein
MNASNPFQIPVCLQRADSEQRRRERFKRGFIATLAATVVLLVGLLIEGCMTEQTANSTETTSSTATDLPAPRLNQPVAVSPQPDSGVQSNPAATHTPAAAMASQNSTATSHSETLYVIKPGDTLTRIAKTHGTTVKALKAANGLGNDRIVVGAKLKIPEA